MKINKAIITCAGFGTRFLPISKTIQKEMLPILSRPTIDYVVEDCIRAGVTDIIIVMNQHNYQPLHYYRENKRLKKYLSHTNKTELYQQISNLHTKANFIFVKQDDQDPYGTSIPVKLAQEYVQDEEAFLYLTGDDFIFYPEKERNLIQDLIKLYQESQAKSAITCIELPWEELHRYGTAEVREDNGFLFLTAFVEKPKPGEAKSNLANVSKYILTPEIFSLIDQQQPNPSNHEYYITDVVLQLSQKNKVVVKNAGGYYLNSGEPLTWLKANLAIAASNPKLKSEIELFMKKEWIALTKDK